ncbi:outer membrane lipoprotein carrier protein LolA [Rhodobacterales bacterium HKCCE3408]|nr:outer membrane lipoprotein carrier protein LolA [Rhodobacterales bacterium HKCCE3408]
MKRFALAAITAAVTALPAAAQDAIPLRALSDYLNNIRTAEAGFTQVNADGTVSTGTVYINRPGRVRFEYDGEDVLVMAGGGQVAIFDGRSNVAAEQYPLEQTPLSLILARNVDLGRSGMVVAHEGDGTTTRVVAQDPDRPDIGSITLVFTDDPVELRQWVITDEGGQETTVILGGMETGGRLPARLFSIPQEIQSRG